MMEHNLHFERLGSSEQALLTLNDFFHGGKTARQKEAEKRLKEQEELQRKEQELIDQTHPLANKDKYLVADTLDPFLRPAGAYPRTYGSPSPDTATTASTQESKQKENEEFRQSFVGVMHDDKGASFGGGGFDIKSDTPKRPAKEKSIITKNSEPESSSWDKALQVLDIAASFLSNFPNPWAKATGKIAKLALGAKKAHQVIKIYDKTNYI